VRVVLFALTGLGNIVFKNLLKKNIEIKKLITRSENGPYPYYKCENIVKIAKKYHIPYSFDETSYNQYVDLYLVASYHKKILLNKNSFKYAINIHPSYLPMLKGRDPIKDALDNNYSYTGVTAHHITNVFDTGPILYQKKIKIYKSDTKSTILKRMEPIYDNFTDRVLRKVARC
jgi:methionyl-tRNA formyltransferase